jgi:hypothetical protein
VVQIHPDPPLKLAIARGNQQRGAILSAAFSSADDLVLASISRGAIAQLGEHLPCKQRVGGSNPPGSTI